MIRKLIIIKIFLVLIFQPISQAFSEPLLAIDQDPVYFGIELSSEHCESDLPANCSSQDSCKLSSNSDGSHSNHINCELKTPIGIPVFQILAHAPNPAYHDLTNKSYIFLLPDTLLRPPRNS